MTRETFAQKIAGKLGIYDQNDLDAPVQSQLLDIYDGVYQQLKDDGLVTWVQGDNEDIPDRLFLNLSMIVAGECLVDFNITGEAAAMIANNAARARKVYARQLQSGQDTGTTEAEYF